MSSNSPLEVVFAGGAERGCLDVPEDPLERLIQVRVAGRMCPDVDEELRRQDVEALLLDRSPAAELGGLVGKVRVVELEVAPRRAPPLLIYAVKFSEMNR